MRQVGLQQTLRIQPPDYDSGLGSAQGVGDGNRTLAEAETKNLNRGWVALNATTEHI